MLKFISGVITGAGIVFAVLKKDELSEYLPFEIKMKETESDESKED